MSMTAGSSLRAIPHTLNLKRSNISNIAIVCDEDEESQNIILPPPHNTSGSHVQSFEAFVASLNKIELKTMQDSVVMPVLERDFRRYSSVQHWREDVQPLNVYGPPTSPLNISSFPTSPVAIIHPAQLRVTSLPPFSQPGASSSSTLLSAEDLVLLEDIGSDLDASSDTSSIPSIHFSTFLQPHIPLQRQQRESMHAEVQLYHKKKTIVWFPRRLKYSWLSFARRLAPSSRPKIKP